MIDPQLDVLMEHPIFRTVPDRGLGWRSAGVAAMSLGNLPASKGIVKSRGDGRLRSSPILS
jgi:hypothetical protein